jgi:hypothetical protein
LINKICIIEAKSSRCVCLFINVNQRKKGREKKHTPEEGNATTNFFPMSKRINVVSVNPELDLNQFEITTVTTTPTTGDVELIQFEAPAPSEPVNSFESGFESTPKNTASFRNPVNPSSTSNNPFRNKVSPFDMSTWYEPPPQEQPETGVSGPLQDRREFVVPSKVPSDPKVSVDPKVPFVPRVTSSSAAIFGPEDVEIIRSEERYDEEEQLFILSDVEEEKEEEELEIEKNDAAWIPPNPQFGPNSEPTSISTQAPKEYESERMSMHIATEYEKPKSPSLSSSVLPQATQTVEPEIDRFIGKKTPSLSKRISRHLTVLVGIFAILSCAISIGALVLTYKNTKTLEEQGERLLWIRANELNKLLRSEIGDIKLTNEKTLTLEDSTLNSILLEKSGGYGAVMFGKNQTVDSGILSTDSKIAFFAQNGDFAQHGFISEKRYRKSLRRKSRGPLSSDLERIVSRAEELVDHLLMVLSLSDDGTSRVGINIDNPLFALDVIGGVRFEGDFGMTGDVDIDGVVNVTGDIWVNGINVLEHGTNLTSGLHCWDTNGNHACDLGSEDHNEDGECTVADCAGPQGEDGPTGNPGISCWDLNQNYACDLETEDIDLDGECNVDDCTGPEGPVGAQGDAGTDGYNCWDLNQNHACDLLTEDINMDGACNVTDCTGQQGQTGSEGPTGPQGDTGEQGPAGSDGYHCWDLNQNHACDLGTEDINLDGVCNVTDCTGQQGQTGPQGDTGEQGPAGSDGADGYHCWDLNQNYACDLGTEDINLDGVCNVTDCTGPQGPAGPQGDTGEQGPAGSDGTDGYHCWDLNQNYACDLGTEDINLDGVCNVTDCTGPQGPAGSQGDTGEQGPAGSDGYHCWDLNQNYACDLGTEDINLDGVCNVTDCTGPQGPAGPQGDTGEQGPAGTDGYHCWDLNQNYACDLGTEDINLDGVCNVTDCTGPQGPAGPQGDTGEQGPAGSDGTDGYHCWDLNQNHACDLGSEDINTDEVCNTLDCTGPTGPEGPEGPQGDTGAEGSCTCTLDTFSGHMIPETTNTATLGNSTRVMKAVHTRNLTIYEGIFSSGSGVTFNSDLFLAANKNLGTISNKIPSSYIDSLTTTFTTVNTALFMVPGSFTDGVLRPVADATDDISDPTHRYRNAEFSGNVKSATMTATSSISAPRYWGMPYPFLAANLPGTGTVDVAYAASGWAVNVNLPYAGRIERADLAIDNDGTTWTSGTIQVSIFISGVSVYTSSSFSSSSGSVPDVDRLIPMANINHSFSAGVPLKVRITTNGVVTAAALEATVTVFIAYNS